MIGCIGSFEERKGQVQLLDAIDQVRSSVPNVHVMLVGDGPDEAMLRAHVVERGLEPHVTFFPFTTEPAHVFEILDILALSSTHKEGSPTCCSRRWRWVFPSCRAASRGHPKSSSKASPGCWSSRATWRVSPTAIRTLAEDDEARTRMGAAGQRMMQDDFDKLHQFDAFLAHFAQVVASPS